MSERICSHKFRAGDLIVCPTCLEEKVKVTACVLNKEIGDLHTQLADLTKVNKQLLTAGLESSTDLGKRIGVLERQNDVYWNALNEIPKEYGETHGKRVAALLDKVTAQGERIAELEGLLKRCHKEVTVAFHNEGGCDHEAGICGCFILRLLSDIQSALTDPKPIKIVGRDTPITDEEVMQFRKDLEEQDKACADESVVDPDLMRKHFTGADPKPTGEKGPVDKIKEVCDELFLKMPAVKKVTVERGVTVVIETDSDSGRDLDVIFNTELIAYDRLPGETIEFKVILRTDPEPTGANDDKV